jgi:hypothetical protein
MTAFLANLPVNPILPINLILGVLLFRLTLKIYVVPSMATWSPAKLLTPILLLHMLRELGLMFMFPGATLPGMPDAFAVPAALGDFMAAVLATVALFAVQRGTSMFKIQPKTWVWIFNISPWRWFSSRPCTWARRIGYRRFGCRCCWPHMPWCSFTCASSGSKHGRHQQGMLLVNQHRDSQPLPLTHPF